MEYNYKAIHSSPYLLLQLLSSSIKSVLFLLEPDSLSKSLKIGLGPSSLPSFT